MIMKGFVKQLHDEKVTPEEFKNFVEEYLDRCYHGGNYELTLGYIMQSKLEAEYDLEIAKYSNDQYLYLSAQQRLLKFEIADI